MIKKGLIKFYIRTEINKGYIPSDKQHLNKIPFEIFGLGNFLSKGELKEFGEDFNKHRYNKEMREIIMARLINLIGTKPLFCKIEKEGYHKYFYLNVNHDGVDLFISRQDKT